MNKRTGLPFRLPQVAVVSRNYEDGSTVEFLAEAETFFWEGRMKKSTPPDVRIELLGWIAIQRERKRIGLPYLTFSSSSTRT